MITVYSFPFFLPERESFSNGLFTVISASIISPIVAMIIPNGISLVSVISLLREIITYAVALRSFQPYLDLLATEHKSPSSFVMGDALEVHPATDGLQFWITGNHSPQFVDIYPVFR